MTPLHPTNLIAVPVPEDANYTVYRSKRLEVISNSEGINSFAFNHEIKVIGTVTADTIDFDVADYVGEEVMTIHKQTLLKYPDSEYKKESFRSLLTANDVLFENPYGEHKPLTKKYLIEAWQTAQSKVNNKYVILEKK